MEDNAYEQCIEFVADFLSVKKNKLSPGTTLCNDLGVDGDDGVEFMEAFFEKFNVKYEDDFNIKKYFTPESECATNPLLMVISIFVDTVPYLQPITIQDLVDSIRAGKWIK